MLICSELFCTEIEQSQREGNEHSLLCFKKVKRLGEIRLKNTKPKQLMQREGQDEGVVCELDVVVDMFQFMQPGKSGPG